MFEGAERFSGDLSWGMKEDRNYDEWKENVHVVCICLVVVYL